jgi:hypothetical protein
MLRPMTMKAAVAVRTPRQPNSRPIQRTTTHVMAHQMSTNSQSGA